MEKLKLGVIGVGSVVREIYQHLYFSSEYSHLISVEAVAEHPSNEKGLHEFCDKYKIPRERRFTSYQEMIRTVKLDAAQVNTPDSLHEQPTLCALDAGLDVLVPKPMSDKVASAHRMMARARVKGRLLGIDFHKRDDPRLKEAAARYQKGEYGQFQVAVWYMIDKLLVADPNFSPRFFASADFAVKNSPVSFLTVHMADAFIRIVNLKPVSVRATGYSQKLPSLRPIAVAGYDMVDTEIVFDNGGTAHIITGWHLPNGAHSLTVQSARIIATDGALDLGLDTPGYHELGRDGIVERNPLFRNFEGDGTVTGYGMSRPGRLLAKFARNSAGQLDDRERTAMMTPIELGFWTTVVLEAAEQSLQRGVKKDGVTTGVAVEVAGLLRQELGADAAGYL